MYNPLKETHVPETSIGKWFLSSNTWTTQVLEIALKDLSRLLGQDGKHYSVIADVGCGYGRSLKMLEKRFGPDKLIAIDIDPEMIDATTKEAKLSGLKHVEYQCCSSAMTELANDSVDMLFCHQTFHHIIDQQEAITEFFRILKPGGVLLFAESTKRYIHSWIIRLLFRHPMDVQKTASEYLSMIKSAGFTVNNDQISYPFLWWSREDFAILENWFGIKPPEKREETLINLIAYKPHYETECNS